MGLFDKLVRAATTSQPQLRKSARIFVRHDGVRMIVVTMHHNQDGVLCEDPNPVLLESPTDTMLGKSVLAALGASSKVVLDLRDSKRSDWPAYIASGARSIRQFEKTFTAVHVSAANEHNLVFEVEGFLEDDAELRVSSTISSDAKSDELGARIRRVAAAARDRRL